MTQAGADRPVLEARNLVKKFGDLTAVGGIDLSVGAGECVALLGPNGAGKTTTVEMLEGLVKPTSGSVNIFGMDLSGQRAAIMERVGVLLQETNLYKRYTVRETLDLFGSFYQNPAWSEEIIGLLNLTDKSDVQLRNLSGGQKQRVYLGACLINNPELIFLDEPTTGLDPQSRRSIWDLLLSLKSERRTRHPEQKARHPEQKARHPEQKARHPEQSEGPPVSILLTTHYMEEAERLADRVAIIDHGKIIAQGTVDGLIREHCGGKVITITLTRDHAPVTGADLAGTVRKLSGAHKVFANAVCTDLNCEIFTEAAGPTITAVIDSLRDTNLQMPELNMRTGSLEDVFIKLTGRSIRDA